jgi:dynein heavy chain 2
MQVRGKDLHDEMEKFGSRYQAMKPKQVTELNKEQAQDMAENMRSWRQQWKTIEEKVNQIWKDHDHFEMNRPTFPQLETIQSELAQQEQVWELYDQFTAKVDELGKEDWLAYRTKLYTF